MRSGVSFPSDVGTSLTAAPVSLPGALHSSTAMWLTMDKTKKLKGFILLNARPARGLIFGYITPHTSFALAILLFCPLTATTLQPPKWAAFRSVPCRAK